MTSHAERENRRAILGNATTTDSKTLSAVACVCVDRGWIPQYSEVCSLRSDIPRLMFHTGTGQTLGLLNERGILPSLGIQHLLAHSVDIDSRHESVIGSLCLYDF